MEKSNVIFLNQKSAKLDKNIKMGAKIGKYEQNQPNRHGYA